MKHQIPSSSFKLHLDQLKAMLPFMLFALLIGSVVSAKNTPATPLPSPTPISAISPSPAAFAFTPTASPSVAATKPPTKQNNTTYDQKFFQSLTRPNPATPPSSAPPPVTLNQNFTWGVSVKPYPFRESNETFLPQQLEVAKKLGVDTIRVDYTVANDAINQLAVAEAKKYGIKIIFIIDFGPKDIYTDTNLKSNAYDYVKYIVEKYKGDVEIWQLGNEVASVALADEHRHGIAISDYPEDKYAAVSTWLKAAAKAVRDTDPKAKILLTDQWVHTGFFERFIKEQGDFDILGWNWFSDMGTDMNNVHIDQKQGQVYRLMTTIKSFKKTFWLMEVNRRYGARDGKEDEQAEFIQTMADYAAREPAISGFFVFNLVGDQWASAYQQDYGLVKADRDLKLLNGFRLAFWRYQKIISDYRSHRTE